MTAPQTVAEVLDAAADLLTPEGAWTQGSYARIAGLGVGDGRAEGADCWCAIGALEKVSGKLVGRELTDPIFEVIGLSIFPSIVTWNDDADRTQAEVVSTLHTAAALARGEKAHV